MASIPAVVGYVIVGVALLYTVVHIIFSLSDEGFREQLGTVMKGIVNYLTAPAPNIVNNNQTYHINFTQPCHFTLAPGKGQALAALKQIQGSHLPKIAYDSDSDSDSDSFTDWL